MTRRSRRSHWVLERAMWTTEGRAPWWPAVKTPVVRTSAVAMTAVGVTVAAIAAVGVTATATATTVTTVMMLNWNTW